MATLHARGAAALFALLLLGGAPSWAATTPRHGASGAQREGLQAEVGRIFRLVLGHISEKIGNTLDPNGGAGSPPAAPSTGMSPDIGNTLDPNG